MIRYLMLFLIFSVLTSFVSSSSQNYIAGEFLKYRIHYGFLDAGYATLEIKNSNYDGRKHFQMIGKGSSAGAVRVFYVVDDYYETFIDAATNKPSLFVRNISEGGYKRYQVTTFDHRKNIAIVDDRLKNTKTNFRVESDIQDLLSAFYYLRNMDTDALKEGDFMDIDVLLSDGIYKFKLKLLGREPIKSKFGTVNALKLRPYVQSGRVFKASESVTMWVTDDKNHIPIQIKAELAVGSLKADIHEFRNLKYPVNFVK
ncbi:MAG: DUF3108 domain-containing protein [Weeksellaceae bacterium]